MMGFATELEEEDLFAELDKRSEDEDWRSMIQEILMEAEKDPSYQPVIWEPMIMEMLGDKDIHHQPAIRRSRLIPLPWLRYAAAIALIFGAAVFLFTRDRKPEKDTVYEDEDIPLKYDALPGKNGATLTLANGNIIVLDSLGNGLVAEQGGTQVLLKDGQLTYDAAGAAEVSYNTISTPRGHQFHIQLPDGTHVWLNAASSIVYPTAFIDKERRVKVSGEVYLEVAKNADKPFKVQVNEHTEIEALGTRFNINAYLDEPVISATLLEGAIRVSAYAQRQTLSPGQQSQVMPTGAVKLVDDINISQVMAWKNDAFGFDGKSIKEIMRQLSRWYDIDIVFEGDIPTITLGGEMGRDIKLSKALDFLQEAGLRFRMENNGKTLRVYSK